MTFADGAFTTEGAATVAGSAKDDIERQLHGLLRHRLRREPWRRRRPTTGRSGATVVATLSGDTFAAGVQRARRRRGCRRPTCRRTGCRRCLTRTSDTKVTLTLTDKATDHAATDSISNLTITFADAAFANESAANVVRQRARTTSRSASRPPPASPTRGPWRRAAANDGSVGGEHRRDAHGRHVRGGVQRARRRRGCPRATCRTGLTAVLTRTSDRKVTLTLTGKADEPRRHRQHLQPDDHLRRRGVRQRERRAGDRLDQERHRDQLHGRLQHRLRPGPWRRRRPTTGRSGARSSQRFPATRSPPPWCRATTSGRATCRGI